MFSFPNRRSSPNRHYYILMIFKIIYLNDISNYMHFKWYSKLCISIKLNNVYFNWISIQIFECNSKIIYFNSILIYVFVIGFKILYFKSIWITFFFTEFQNSMYINSVQIWISHSHKFHLIFVQNSYYSWSSWKLC